MSKVCREEGGNTSYVLDLENRNYTEKAMDTLILGIGTEVNDTGTILSAVENDKNLYKKMRIENKLGTQLKKKVD